MARLLAGQGHRDRALRIYDTLLATDGGDESLRAEADALRRRAG
jgi:Tfp pilus assembly protein FimV